MWRFVIIDFCWEIDRQIETDLFPLPYLTEIGSVSICGSLFSLLGASDSAHGERALQYAVYVVLRCFDHIFGIVFDDF